MVKNALEKAYEGPQRDSAGFKFLEFLSDAVVIHDVGTAYPKEKWDSGVETGPCRALVLPTTRAVYVPESFRAVMIGQSDYLRSIGIGPDPKNVRYVATPGETTLLQAAWHDMQLRGEPSQKLSLYAQGAGTQDFFTDEASDRLHNIENRMRILHRIKKGSGLSSLRTAGATEGVGNNKLFLRMSLEQRLGELGKELNIDFVGLSRRENPNNEWQKRVGALLARSNNAVLVKTTNRDSSDGILFATKLEDVLTFIRKEREKEPHREFVIEQDLRDEKDIELNAQFLVQPDGEVVFLGGAQNIITKMRPGDTSAHWWGSLIRGRQKDTANKSLFESVPKIIKLAEHYAKLGYRGYLGIDFLCLKDGATKILEINARITETAYLVAIFEQLANTLRTRDFVALSTNTVEFASGSDEIYSNFEDIKQKLGDLLFTNERRHGVIPTHVAQLPRRLGLTVIAQNTDEARSILDVSCRRLGATKQDPDL